ncbi:hypothetical protein [Vagococcus sp.]|uniref:hypothetical protein n=1 Tax=Vagococcus sp. TaxID=1933889 RepID=UPI003F9B37D8
MAFFRKKVRLNEFPLKLSEMKIDDFDDYYRIVKNKDQWSNDLKKIKGQLIEKNVRQNISDFNDELSLIESEINHSLHILQSRKKS